MSDDQAKTTLESAISYSEDTNNRLNSELVLLENSTVDNDNNIAEGIDQFDASTPQVVTNLVREAQADANIINKKGKPKKDIHCCQIKSCPHTGISFGSLAGFLQHHNNNHRFNVRLSSTRMDKLGVYACAKCDRQVISNETPCSHKILNTHTASELFEMSCPWSITITATGTDIPFQCFDDFAAFLDSSDSKKYICCLERGDKDNHRHIQCAAELCRHPDKGIPYIYIFDTCILIYIVIYIYR